MVNFFRIPTTLGVRTKGRYVWGSAIILFAAIAASLYWKNRFPPGATAIVLGVLFGIPLALLILQKLPRDLHVSAIAGVTGLSADGLLSGIKDNFDLTWAHISGSLVKISAVLGPTVLATITASGLGAPDANIVSYGVIAFLATLLVLLIWTLSDNPPSVDSVIANSDKYSQEDRKKLADNF
jgi:hypothetical protein